MWDAWGRGDQRAAVAAVPAQVLRDLMIGGSTDEIHEHVERYFAASVDTAFLQLITFEQDLARKRRVLLEALRALAPAGRRI
jgi:alkanesulfonate monooxygenase SsuD/methylene tetrahydromethanopterin reductase-like flavin-dependent oxidoreductase (luciferase family)